MNLNDFFSHWLWVFILIPLVLNWIILLSLLFTPGYYTDSIRVNILLLVVLVSMLLFSCVFSFVSGDWDYDDNKKQ